MPPRFPSSPSHIRTTRRLYRRPSRLTLGAAAATVVAAVGVLAGVTSGAARPAHAVPGLAAISRAEAVHADGHGAGASSSAAHGPAPSGQPAPRTALAHRPDHPLARVRPASRERPRHRPAGQHPRHQATARSRTAPQQARPRHTARPVRHARPYLIYDSVTPSAIPAHHVVAAYATGNYAASPAQLADRGRVLWIDITGMDPAASILDVEPGNATPALAASWARQRLSAKPNAVARIYTMRSEWPAVQAAVATLPQRMRSRIRWWIADPTGYPHIVPGADATQWYWGHSYDISTATPRF